MPTSRNRLMLIVSERDAVLAELRLNGGALSVTDAFTTSTKLASNALAVGDAAVVNELATAVTLKRWKGRDVTCLVSGATVSCQFLELPQLTGASLRSAARLKLSQQLHYKLDEALVWIDPTVTPAGDGGGLLVACAAMHQTHARLLADVCERIGLQPARLSPASSAVAVAGRAGGAVRGQGLEAILNVGERDSFLLIFNDGRVTAISDVPFCLGELTAALMRPIIKGDDVIQLETADARRLRDEIGVPPPGETIASLGVTTDRVLPLLEPVLQQLCRQLTQWISFARASAGGQPVAAFAVIGAGAGLRGLSESIGKRLGIPAQACSWPGEWTIQPAASEVPTDKLLPAAGAALATAGRGTRPDGAVLPDLLPPDIRRAHTIERIRRSSVVVGPMFAAVMLVMTFMLRAMSGSLHEAQAAQQALLTRSQTELAECVQWQLHATQVRQRLTHVNEFAERTPDWEGVFRELSNILPRPVRLVSLTTRIADNRLVLRLSAEIRTEEGGAASFNELVEQTLGVLNASPFFLEVDVLSAISSPPEQAGDPETGTLAADLKLAYPTGPAPRKPIGGAS